MPYRSSPCVTTKERQREPYFRHGEASRDSLDRLRSDQYAARKGGSARTCHAVHSRPGSRQSRRDPMSDVRIETDSLGEVHVPADKLWGAQTQRSLEHFSIGRDLIPREMISAYAVLKKAAANANHAGKRLDDRAHGLIVQVCDEI